MRTTYWTKQTSSALSLIFCSTMLVACGNSEPSETEIFDAMKSSGADLVNESDRTSFKKGACEKAGEKTFKCSFGYKTGNGMMMSFTFVKVDGKWQVSMN